MGKIFRILSIDGGGIRGIIPAMMLSEIEARTGCLIHEMFDMIAGTSTGAIIALGLTKPDGSGSAAYRAQDGVTLYEEVVPLIFGRSLRRKLSTLDGLINERYPTEPVESALQRFLGETSLKAALTPVLVTSYDIHRRIPWFFRSWRAVDEDDHDFPMKVVARAATAAPTYFAPANLEIGDGNCYSLIDGGVFANNPTMCAFVDAMTERPEIRNYLVVSLGTGDSAAPILYDPVKGWGSIGWFGPGIDILLHGGNETVDYQMRMLLSHSVDGRQRYYRFQPRLGKVNSALDDTTPENISALKRLTQQYIDENGAVIDDLCSQLMNERSGSFSHNGARH